MSAAQQFAIGIATSFLAPIGLGWGVGVLSVYALHRERLRWTWTLLGLPLSYLFWSIDFHLGLFATATTLTAIRLGWREHAEIVQHGGEAGRRKSEHHGPLRWALSHVRRRRVRTERLKDGHLAVGTLHCGRPCRVPFGDSKGVHGLVVGATDSGKTVTQAAIAQAYVHSGQAAIVLDPKGDDYLRSVLEQAAKQRGVKFREWSPSGFTVYNPLSRGNPTEIADKALAGHRWSEAHYEVATQRLLGHVLATMKAASIWPPSLGSVVRHMDLERLDNLASDVGGKIADRVCAYVDGLSARAKADLHGGRDRLAVLAEGELGPRLDPTLGGGEVLDLHEAILAGDVVYFHLDSDRYPAASRLLGAALTIDLVSLTGELQGKGLGGLVVIDEFSAFAADQVSRLFGRARSAGVSMLLGTQSLADLRAARPEDSTDTLTEQLLSNIGYAAVHRVMDPDSAERLARVAGTSPSWTLTQRISGEGTMTRTTEGTRTRDREFLISPDEFKSLGTGQAVVINPTARPRAAIAQIWPPCEANLAA